MKILVALLVSFVALTSQAEVSALFSKDGAILLIQGHNDDALRLFNAMKVEPVVNGSIATKHILYQDFSVNPSFELTCNNSQLTATASCTLKFYSTDSDINPNGKSILMGINDRLGAPAIATQFEDSVKDKYRADVFISADRKLRVLKTFSSYGEVVSFTISYN